MDLWVRSNDGVLFEKAEMIKVSNIQDKGCNGKLTNFRYGIVVNNDYVFAEYKSKERALEVLDEINEHIEKQGQTIAITNEKGIVDGLKYYGKTYVMPEE